MKEFECLVGIQRVEETGPLVESIVRPTTHDEQIIRHLGPNDQFCELRCNVGDCAVKGFAELRLFGKSNSKAFVVANPDQCIRNEEALDTDITIIYK
jgi:hypothetical protein